MPDSEIVELLLNRDENALNAIELQYRPLLSGIIRDIVKNDADVSECLNDVYMKIWNSIPPARPDNFKAYICTVARNTAINRYNSNNRKSDIPRQLLLSTDDGSLPEPAAPERTDEAVERKLREDRICALIVEYTRALPPGDQKICVARYFYNAKLRTIARQCGLPVGTVKSALNRIKKGIAAFLKKEGIEDD